MGAFAILKAQPDGMFKDSTKPEGQGKKNRNAHSADLIYF